MKREPKNHEPCNPPPTKPQTRTDPRIDWLTNEERERLRELGKQTSAYARAAFAQLRPVRPGETVTTAHAEGTVEPDVVTPTDDAHMLTDTEREQLRRTAKAQHARAREAFAYLRPSPASPDAPEQASDTQPG